MTSVELTTPLRARVQGGGTPRPERWGIENEYGVLRDVLLGSADGSAGWARRTRSTRRSCARSLRKGGASTATPRCAQYAEMVDAYRQAGVAVHVLEAQDELAYGVYARDSNFMTPFGAVVCQLANPRRRGEYATTLRFFVEHDIPVYDLVSAGNFEGGDFNLSLPDAALIGYTGRRGEEVAAEQVGGWMEAEGLEVVYAPIDEFYVHIDLMVCMVAEKLAAVCLDTTDRRTSSRGCAARASRSCPSPFARRWAWAATSSLSGTSASSRRRSR